MYNLANALVIAKDTLTLIVNYTSASPWEAESWCIKIVCPSYIFASQEHKGSIWPSKTACSLQICITDE
jgi:hypothetical protein